MALAAAAQLVGSVDFLFSNFSESFLERGITTAEVGVKKAQIRELVAAVVVAALVALPAHFVYGLATLGHLGPAFAALAIFALGAALSYPR